MWFHKPIAALLKEPLLQFNKPHDAFHFHRFGVSLQDRLEKRFDSILIRLASGEREGTGRSLGRSWLQHCRDTQRGVGRERTMQQPV